PGVIARVGTVLSDKNISIASVVQKETGGDPETGVPLVIITRETTAGAVDQAVREIDKQSIVLEPTHTLRILDVL
ncbi:MAG: ACT domain-containing protein, partial [Gemmatimonadota bacterium]|nr:ACT domain-containing protein [Gemmatimonadota bacterium]